MSGIAKALWRANYLKPLAEGLKQWREEKQKEETQKQYIQLMNDMQNNAQENYKPRLIPGVEKPQIPVESPSDMFFGDYQKGKQTEQNIVPDNTMQNLNFNTPSGGRTADVTIDPRTNKSAYQEATNKTKQKLFETFMKISSLKGVDQADVNNKLSLFSKFMIPDAPQKPEEVKYQSFKDEESVYDQYGKLVRPGIPKPEKVSTSESIAAQRFGYDMGRDKKEDAEKEAEAQAEYNAIMSTPYMSIDELKAQGLLDEDQIKTMNGKYGGGYATKDDKGEYDIVYTNEALENYAKRKVTKAPNKWSRKGTKETTKSMSKDEFISDFEKDVGRKPSKTEVNKAKEKGYWK